MMYVYLVTLKVRFEYSNNVFEKEWTHSENLYCYTSELDAKKDIWKRKQKETRKYSQWLKQDEETRGLFIHHIWEIEKKFLFNTTIED